MQSLNKPTGPNIGGGKRIEVCPVHLFAGFTGTGTVEDPIVPVFETGGSWFACYSTPNTLDINLKPETKDGCTVYRSEITANHPGDASFPILDRWKQYMYFVVRVTDQNGVVRFHGTKEVPMVFDFTHAVGGKASGWRGFNLSFRQVLPEYPPIGV